MWVKKKPLKDRRRNKRLKRIQQQLLIAQKRINNYQYHHYYLAHIFRKREKHINTNYNNSKCIFWKKKKTEIACERCARMSQLITFARKNKSSRLTMKYTSVQFKASAFKWDPTVNSTHTLACSPYNLHRALSNVYKRFHSITIFLNRFFPIKLQLYYDALITITMFN